MIQKNKDSNSIGFLENFFNQQAEKEKLAEKQVPFDEKPKLKAKVREEYKPQATSKLSEFNPLVDSRNPSKSITSSSGGTQTDIGGPKKYMGSQTNNSIWNPDTIEKLIQSQDNKEKTIAEKNEIKDIKEQMQKDRIDSLVEALQNVDQRKQATIQPIEPMKDCSTNKAPKRNISIFVNGDYERVPEKTDGEKLSDKLAEKKAKDDSWKDNKGTLSSKKIVSSLFDKLMQGKEKEE